MTAPSQADPAVLADLAVDDAVVARYVSGEGLDAMLSPRPFLHPVRTLAAVPVTDERPADHRWHLGLGVAIQDVGGVNVWGGRTFVRGEGYTWRGDHGWVEHRRFVRLTSSAFAAELSWHAPDGRALLHEVREVEVAPVPQGWRLWLRFTLRNVTSEPLPLGSPATNGRVGAGYGGFFWRFPPLKHARVATPDAEGESAVHGSTAAWVAVSAGVASPRVPGATLPVTVVLAGADAATRADPWFVRMSGYPGVGLSLAAERPLLLAPGEHVTRTVAAAVADGGPDPAGLARHLTADQGSDQMRVPGR